MPAKNDVLFQISRFDLYDSAIGATLQINRDCTLLKGHFPGQPVVPGACMLQIVKEVVAAALNTSLRLEKAEHLKFITMIDPENTPSVELDITYKVVSERRIVVTAKLTHEAVVYFKFQGTFTQE